MMWKAENGGVTSLVCLVVAWLLLGSSCRGGEDPPGPSDGGLDGAAPLDAAADSDRGLDGDGDGRVDGDPDRGRDADLPGPDSGDQDGSEPACDEPQGAACNPFRIDAFPFHHSWETGPGGQDLIDVYGCAPSTDEGGPEVHYEVILDSPGMLELSVDEAPGVDVDIHVLTSLDPDDCLARANTDLAIGLGAGTYRLVVDTYQDGAGTALLGAYSLVVDLDEVVPELLGDMWTTYYYLANEAEHAGPQDTPIYDSSCDLMAYVRSSFHDSVCIEGSGILDDGRVINYASTCTSSCSSAHSCGSLGYRVCYSFLDSERYPWGQGAGDVALVPDYSVAVDPGFVPLGTVIYFEELAGTIPPGESVPHDGCMRADDVGGAIDGNHFDFFSGTEGRWRDWERIFPTGSIFTAWINHPSCF